MKKITFPFLFAFCIFNFTFAASAATFPDLRSPVLIEADLNNAGGEFHSGRSDQQLRILGDVIALVTFWERTPLNTERENDDMVNRPSEIIYEDFRKYVITPPGDKQLPDAGHMWREVHPSTGRPLLESILK
ncbi:MAG: hypothetical protein Q8O95_04515 [bacterium]|nr:hypothetical protein [bacterium]